MTDAWHGGLDDDEIGEVRALVAAVAEADGAAPLSEHVLLHLRHGGDDDGGHDMAHLLVRDPDGTLVAVAQLDGTDPAEGAAELAVHPAHRRRGLGTAVVQELLDRSAGRGLRLWAHGEHPGAAVLADRFEFARVRVLWRMRRSLSAPLAEPRYPDGVTVRPFVVGVDEAEYLRVNNAAFAWHPDQGGWNVEQLKLREAEPWFDPAGFLLAVDADDHLLGFHWTKVHAASAPSSGPAPEPIGEVYVLGVDPSARGLRLGTALTLSGLWHLRDRGLDQVMLYVEADNLAAVRVYEALGFTRWDTDVSYVRRSAFTGAPPEA